MKMPLHTFAGVAMYSTKQMSDRPTVVEKTPCPTVGIEKLDAVFGGCSSEESP